MIDIQKLRDNLTAYKSMCTHRQLDIDVDQVLALDEKRKTLQLQIDQLKHQQKEYAQQQQYDQAKALKEQIKPTEEEFNQTKKKLQELLYTLPNFIHPDVPVGKDENENIVIKTVGTPKSFDFPVKDHEDLWTALWVIDKEKAAQVTGARFVYLKGDIVLLQNAITQLIFDTVTNEKTLQQIIQDNKLTITAKPFTPVIPPLMINFETAEKMGRLHPIDDRFVFPDDNYMMIGSAEHSLWPIHMNETLDEAQLPMRYIANTPAFRREAGTYGKDTRWILRQHQFDKIEMEVFSTAATSEEEQKLIVAIQEYLLQKLDLPYQVMQICTGDMGKLDYNQIDINTYMPGQNTYRETHTSDLMTDYQSRRLNIKVKKTNGETEYVHMNDATACAMGRMLIAIIENNQTKDGKIAIPEALQPYMHGQKNIG